MNETELAKNLLTKNILKAYQVDITGEISIPQQHTELILSINSFEPIEYLKFSIPIRLKNEVFANLKNSNHRYMTFTNWHLENQDLIRDGDFFIWKEYKIYKNELIKCYLTNYTLEDFYDYTNPFSPIKKLCATANIILRCLEPVAKIIIPSLKSLYVVQDEQVC